MSNLNPFGSIDSQIIATAARQFGTPFYLYDERLLIDKCQRLLAMPHAFGITVRFAMKANSTRAILKIISGQGLKIDASSLNEARRARLAGIPYGDILLTTQEAPAGQDMQDLQDMMRQGLRYNVCSALQLQNIADFASETGTSLSVRVSPGMGAGESATRNTGDDYSCFGVHLSDMERTLAIAKDKGLVLDQLHVHIGSGGSPEIWRANIVNELGILEKYFPDAKIISFGGGMKEARMPDEAPADILSLGQYAKEKIDLFYQKTSRKMHVEIEPGTYVAANAGYVVTRVLDKKRTGGDGFLFLVLDGGMELNARPLLYGSRHPFYMISQQGRLLSTEFFGDPGAELAVPVGRCCESGDAQSLTPEGLSLPRPMTAPSVGDYAVIGGAGAYCSSMAPMNYNSHVQAGEVLYTRDGNLVEIRRRQTLEQLLANEI
ncbi:MAG: hypothetical protein FWE59_00400 [Oscillospiraceae bacterium]|nr:hypothetical protein [Oscillospiraceae bacterium]